MPKKVVGMYILLADDTEPGYILHYYLTSAQNFKVSIFSFHSDNYDWEPKLHPYQQLGSNVLFFTFINPETMDVPVAFKKLGNKLQLYSNMYILSITVAATRCTDVEGAVPCDTLVIFAIGG